MRFPSVCPSACPSVCLSVKRVNCAKTKETSAEIPELYKRPIYLVFWQEKWLVSKDPILPEILGQTNPVASEKPISSRYPLVAPRNT